MLVVWLQLRAYGICGHRMAKPSTGTSVSGNSLEVVWNMPWSTWFTLDDSAERLPGNDRLVLFCNSVVKGLHFGNASTRSVDLFPSAELSQGGFHEYHPVCC